MYAAKKSASHCLYIRLYIVLLQISGCQIRIKVLRYILINHVCVNEKHIQA